MGHTHSVLPGGGGLELVGLAPRVLHQTRFLRVGLARDLQEDLLQRCATTRVPSANAQNYERALCACAATGAGRVLVCEMEQSVTRARLPCWLCSCSMILKKGTICDRCECGRPKIKYWFVSATKFAPILHATRQRCACVCVRRAAYVTRQQLVDVSLGFFDGVGASGDVDAVAVAVLVLQVERSAEALDLTVRHDRDTIAQHVGLLPVLPNDTHAAHRPHTTVNSRLGRGGVRSYMEWVVRMMTRFCLSS